MKTLPYTLYIPICGPCQVQDKYINLFQSDLFLNTLNILTQFLLEEFYFLVKFVCQHILMESSIHNLFGL
jgi:hypothetical protein